MMSMSRKALILMALMLAAATAATAATAFATEVDENAVVKQVVRSIHTSSDAQLNTKVRQMKATRGNIGKISPSIKVAVRR